MGKEVRGVEEVLLKMAGRNMQVILLFLGEKNLPYIGSITGLAKILEVSVATAQKSVNNLVEIGIVVKRDIGKSRAILLNEKSPIVRALRDFLESLNSLEMEEAEKKIMKIFGENNLKMILLFLKENDYLNNIGGLTEAVDKSRVTVNEIVTDLVKIGALKEKIIGGSRIIQIDNESLYTQSLRHFLESLEKISVP